MKREFNLLPGLGVVKYATTPYHMLLSDDNIGENGENLSIIVLSCDRAEATIKMMESIKEHMPDFKGEYIIADNGSNQVTIDKLNEEIAKVPYECKLIEFGQNYGVAGGRNRAAKYSTKDWILNLDNDIFFTMNILPEIHDAISQLGCKFLNLPLLNHDSNKIFSLGGNLFLTDDNGTICAGCGGSFEQNECKPGDTFDRSLCTFLFGASVMNKATFLECGGFDEGMFIGFEDLDLSIEIFRRGYKIGCAGVAALVHDHRISTNQSDLEYEKKRFSNKHIFEAAMYFERKHGFRVWSKVTEEWLKEKNEGLGIKNDVGKSNEEYEETKKPKIALIVDVRDWAFDNIAKNIKKYLDDKYYIEIIYMDPDLEQNIIYLFYAVKDFDLVHVFWRGFLNFIGADFYNQYLSYYGTYEPAFLENYIKNKIITTSVYDHKFLSEDLKETNENIFKYVKSYTVSSKKLLDIYNNLGYIKKPETEITDGVDLDLFKPNNISRFKDIKNGNVKVGFVGNSKWVCDDPSEDIKGFNTIIKPAVQELIEEGYKIELYTADRNDKFIPHDEMPTYYNEIDLYICASLNEGTPNPVLEAMACGIPVISTDVGIVAEVFGKKQKEFILKERTKECLKEKIKYIFNNLELLYELSNENLGSITDWTWENKAKQFGEFFENNMK